MAQVAGRRQERRLAVLVAAIAGNRLQRRQRGADLGAVVIGERQRKEPKRIVDVLTFAETGADDDARHAGLIEDEAARDVGDRNAMARGHRRGRLQHALQRAPPAGHPQETAVLHLRPRGEALPVRLRRAEPAFGEPAAGQRAVRQQLHAVLDAEGRQAPRRALIEQRERHLVRHDVDAARDDDAQVRGVEVGQAEVTDQALGLQLLQVEQRFEPARIGVVPGVVLQEVDRLDAEARAARARPPRGPRPSRPVPASGPTS